MREVTPGVWQCLDTATCKSSGSGTGVAAGQGGMMPGGGGGPVRRGGRRENRRGNYGPYNAGGNANSRRQGQRRDRSAREPRYDYANASAWTPSAGTTVVVGERANKGAGPRAFLAERKVWCVLHGKRLPASQCEFVQDCCYICLDSTTCLSAPLEPTTVLLDRGCAELLCSKHHTLRNTGFVDIGEKATVYHCIDGHSCRGTTLPHLTENNEMEQVGDGMVGAGEMEDIEDVEYGGARVTDSFLPQSGRDAVSSFFV